MGAVANFCAKLVARHDFIQGILYDNISFQARRLSDKMGDFADLIWKNRLRITKYFAGGLIVFILMLCVFNYVTGYEYSYNGRTLGIVKDQQQVNEVLDVASDGLTREYGVDVQLNPEKDFSYRRVVATGKELDKSDDILRKLTYVQNAKASAYSIYIDGAKAVTVSTEDEANQILGRIKGQYEDKGKNYDKVYFQEDIEVREVNTTVGKIMNSNVAYDALSGSDAVMNYEVKLGDTADSIAKNNNMTSAQFSELNPEAEVVLKEGDIVKIANTTGNVTVVTEETVNYSEDIDFDTKKVKDEDMYEDDKKVTKKGEKGQKDITAKLVCENGVQTDKIVLNSKVKKEPVTQVVHIGTKERPKDVGTGKFINPCPAGQRTSGFGMRWGRMHRGLDLACAAGNNVYAADNGVVVTAESHYSYGNYIEIDHKNGYRTLYAHNSKLLVKVGDVVEKGQVISKVGSTGNSTGPHCHFQIEKNGTWVNPAPYI